MELRLSLSGFALVKHILLILHPHMYFTVRVLSREVV